MVRTVQCYNQGTMKKMKNNVVLVFGCVVTVICNEMYLVLIVFVLLGLLFNELMN